MPAVGVKICGAKTRSGGTCNQPARPNGRCRMHGGNALVGVASPRFTTGRYSKALPTRLIEKYEAAAKDPDLLALREEVAVTDARLADVLSRVDSGESGALWSKSLESMDDLTAAQRRGDMEAFRDHLGTLRGLIARGVGDWSAWAEVHRLIDHRRRLVESERKRLVEMQQVMTVDRALVLSAALVDIVKRHVTDRKALSEISRELMGLMSRPDGGEPGGG